MVKQRSPEYAARWRGVSRQEAFGICLVYIVGPEWRRSVPLIGVIRGGRCSACGKTCGRIRDSFIYNDLTAKGEKCAVAGRCGHRVADVEICGGSDKRYYVN